MKEVFLQISYIISGNRVYQRASFPLKGRPKEVVAYEWYCQIRREMPYGTVLEKLICNGDQDITETVRNWMPNQGKKPSGST